MKFIATLAGATVSAAIILQIVAALTKDFKLFALAVLVCLASSCALWVTVAIACALKKENK